MNRTDQTSELLIPDWLSSKWPGIAALARTHYDWAVLRTQVDFGARAEVVQRLAIDLRMERVWRELFKRERVTAVDRGYTYRPNEKLLPKHPHWGAIERLSQQPDGRDRLQEQVCVLLFSVAVNSSFERPGLRVQTVAEVTVEVEALHLLAKGLSDNANECERLGQGQFATSLRAMADFVHEQANRRASLVKLQDDAGNEISNPWIAEREGSDRRLRGFAINMVITCRILFNKDLPGIVARIASVVFDREVPEATVRGIAKGIRDPRT